jgi:hypothetical protein
LPRFDSFTGASAARWAARMFFMYVRDWHRGVQNVFFVTRKNKRAQSGASHFLSRLTSTLSSTRIDW